MITLMTSSKCQNGGHTVFVNRAPDGSNNLSGKQIARLRQEKGMSQRELADILQLRGINIDKNAVQRIEAGQRFVTDVELPRFAEALETTVEELLGI